ncbi:MAG: sigma-70 family RNA polymerase sigma factor [Deltaproteobacteria bacterium]|nr:sigma-70 family RNA polymerase sigma factor [Deltaproteobacteria bacterium]
MEEQLDCDGLRRGDPEAVLHFRRVVAWKLRRYLSDKHTVEELTQAVLVDLVADLKRKPALGVPVDSWVHNTCRRHLRPFFAYEARRQAGLPEDASEEPAWLTRLVRAREGLERLLELLESLPEHDRAIFTMRLEGRTPREIAAALDIAVATVYRRFHRCRRKLEDELRRQSSDPALTLAARLRAHRHAQVLKPDSAADSSWF